MAEPVLFGKRRLSFDEFGELAGDAVGDLPEGRTLWCCSRRSVICGAPVRGRRAKVISAAAGQIRWRKRSGPEYSVRTPYCGIRKNRTVSSVTDTDTVPAKRHTPTAADEIPKKPAVPEHSRAAAQKRFDWTVKYLSTRPGGLRRMWASTAPIARAAVRISVSDSNKAVLLSLRRAGMIIV